MSGDCNDASATVSPDATELCNGLDDDCDGVEDNQAIDPTVYFEDTDGDGWYLRDLFVLSNLIHRVTQCHRVDMPPQREIVTTVRLMTHGQPELCTLLIDDCDGHNRLGAVDYLTFWADADRDGFGEFSNQWRCAYHRLDILRWIRLFIGRL